MAWILVFAGCYYLIFRSHPKLLNNPNATPEAISLAAWHSAFTFVELQPGLAEVESEYLRDEHLVNLPRPWPGWLEWKQQYRLLLFLELVIAYLHLGLLISILYRRVTKRSP